MCRIQAHSPAAHRGRRFARPLAVSAGLLVAAALLAACSDQPAPLAPPSPPDSPILERPRGNGGGAGVAGLRPKIAFVSGQAGTWVGAIRAMNPDGTGIVNLTSGTDNSPAWSPDYRKLAFVRNETNGPFIYVVNAAGGQPKLLGPGRSPRWSPDGTRIAFAAIGEDGYYDIHVMSAAGKDVTQLTTAPGSDTDPAWSPDGSKLVFASSRTGNLELFVMNADGTDQTRITHCDIEGGQCSMPSWSPIPGDNRILFYHVGNLFGSVFKAVRIVQGEEGTPVTVVSGTGINRAAWSPDASRIVFSKEATSQNSEVFTVNVDGTGLQQLTNNFLYDFDVAWSR